jgi:hypothetical protein
MTPKNYVDEAKPAARKRKIDPWCLPLARPSVEEFAGTPTSIRRAWTAAAALFHLRDWVAKDRGVNPSVVQTDFEAGFPQFRALADIANASKHFNLDREGPRRGLSAKHFAVGPGPPFLMGLITMTAAHILMRPT